MPVFRFFQETKAPPIPNTDSGTTVEQGITLPWTIDPRVSWLDGDYPGHLEVQLDPGLVIHKPLPQSTQTADTLALVDAFDPRLDLNKSGSTPKSAGTFTDIVQQMATSEYRFCLKGWVFRVGYRIPIPGLRTVWGVQAFPDFPHKIVDNQLVGNFSGVPLWFASWELWYFVALPPQVEKIQLPNIPEHIRGNQQLPKTLQAPWSQTDQRSKPSPPPPLPIRRVAP